MKLSVTCDRCGGTGQYENLGECRRCAGKGVLDAARLKWLKGYWQDSLRRGKISKEVHDAHQQHVDEQMQELYSGDPNTGETSVEQFIESLAGRFNINSGVATIQREAAARGARLIVRYE